MACTKCGAQPDEDCKLPVKENCVMPKHVRAKGTTTIATGPAASFYNAALERQEIKLKVIVDDTGATGLHPTVDGETVEEQVEDLVNRLVELDSITCFVMALNVHILADKMEELRRTFEQGGVRVAEDDGWSRDDFDDLIAGIEGVRDNLQGLLVDAKRGVRRG